MKKLSFSDLGYKWERVTRPEARRRYERGEAVMLCPVNLRPGYPYNPQLYVYKSSEDPETFETVENRCGYYNLTPETGRYFMYFKNAGRA